MTTGAIFGLIVVAHVWRIVEEGTHLAADPGYMALTAASGALCVWAGRLLMRRRAA